MEVKKDGETRGVERTRRGKEEEGIIVMKVDIEGKEWRIIGVYVNGDMEKKIEKLKKYIERGKKEKIMTIRGETSMQELRFKKGG